MARSGDQWASRVKALKEDNDNEFPEDSNAEIQVAKNGFVFEWRTSDKYCYFHDFDFGWSFFDEWRFFQRLQVNIYDSISKTNNQDFENVKRKLKSIAPYSNVFYPFLPACLKENKEKYSFRNRFETIDKRQCLVLEWPNHDVIWLDPKLGYLVKKRVIYFEEMPIIKYAITNRDFREIKPGLWIPFVQVEDNYADIHHNLKSDWGKIIQQITYNVTSFAIEKPSEEIFNPPVQPGNLVWDSKRNIEYTITAQDADPFAGPLGQGIKTTRITILRYILVMFGAVMVLIAAWFKHKNGKTQ